MTTAEPRAIQGREVLQETARYLGTMRFSTTRGAFAEGKYVAILVDPRLDDDRNLSVRITCRAFGQRAVDWNRLAVWVEDPARGILALGPAFNSRGQKHLPPLPPGSYSLRVGTRTGEEVLLHPEVARGAAVTGLKAVRTRGSTGRSRVRERRVYHSLDGTIRATLLTMAAGIEVAFETGESNYADREVAFAFIRADSGQVEMSGRATLAASKDAPARWKGVWKGRVESFRPCELVFGLVPARDV
jgi:hypothetical protein